MSENIMTNEALEQVTGGTGSSDGFTTADYQTFESLWEELLFTENGYTRHQMDAYCDEYRNLTPRPTIRAFLESKVEWSIKKKPF